MRRLGSVSKAHKCADDDGEKVIEIIFSAKKIVQIGQLEQKLQHF